jgi:conjugative transposon TraM protein
MKPHSQKFLEKKKFVMVLPLLVLPFLTMIFWALGGGQGSPAQPMATEKTGLNLELPNAHFNTEEWNKLSLYEKAERDSLKFEEEGKNDPYFNLATLEDQNSNDDQEVQPKQKTKSTSNSRHGSSSQKQGAYVDPNEAKVNQKLDQLYRELNKTSETQNVPDKAEPAATEKTDPQFSSDVQKLEQMMEMMGKGDQNDPEMQQVGGMLDKILDIQHPERVREKIKERSEQMKGQVFPVDIYKAEENISFIKQDRKKYVAPTDSSALLSKALLVQAQQNSFYGLEGEVTEENTPGNAIEAVIHDTQELVAGSTVKMRLMSDVYINGRLIPRGQFIHGTCAINGERLTIAINSVRDENSLFPVSLSAYDMDGLEGIYIPGAITRDAAKQSSDQAMQSMQILSMDQSLSAQAANAGVAAAKGLFSKKVKLIKVLVKAGYKILLKDGNNRA